MEKEAKIIPTDNPGHNPGHQAGNPKYPMRNIPSPGTYLLGHYADGSLDLIRVKGLPEGTDEHWHLEVECPNIEPYGKGHQYLTPAVLVDMTRRANDEDFQAFIIEQKQSLMDVRKTYKGDPGGMVDWFRRGIDAAYEWWKEFRDKRGIDPPPPLSQVAPKGQRTLFGNPPAAPPPPEVPAAEGHVHDKHHCPICGVHRVCEICGKEWYGSASGSKNFPILCKVCAEEEFKKEMIIFEKQQEKEFAKLDREIQKDETEPVFIGQDWECFEWSMEYTEAIKLEGELREAGRTVRKEPRDGMWDVYIRKWDKAAAPPAHETLDEYIGIQKEETAVPEPPKEKQKTLEQYLNGG